MSRHANFIIVNDSRTALTILDLGPHNKHPTITNDVEWVVEQLTHRLSGRKLFYYDSENQLDEILVKNGKFASFGPGSIRSRD